MQKNLTSSSWGKSMKKWLDEYKSTLIGVMLIILGLAGIVFYIVILCRYGNTPISELPSWVAWLLFKKG